MLQQYGMLHRNVIFRGSEVIPHAFSNLDVSSTRDLFQKLDAACQLPCRVITIPHNNNYSWGLMFSRTDEDGAEYQAQCPRAGFLPACKAHPEQLRLAQAELNGAPTNLIIGVGKVRPAGFTSAIYEALLKRYPQLTVSFVEEYFQAFYTAVEKGEVDVAFVAGPALESLPAALRGNVLARTEFRVICSADHPLSHYDGPVPIKELKKFSWVRNTAAP